MLVKQDAVKLLEAFNASVTGLLREISDKLKSLKRMIQIQTELLLMQLTNPLEIGFIRVDIWAINSL